MSTGRRNGRICVTWAVEVSAPALQISPIPLTSMFAEHLWILFLKIKITLFADIYRTSVVHKTLTSSASQLRRKKQWDIAVHYPVTLILHRHPLLPPSFHYFLPYYTRACVCVCVRILCGVPTVPFVPVPLFMTLFLQGWLLRALVFGKLPLAFTNQFHSIRQRNTIVMFDKNYSLQNYAFH